jgi:hypothetical protein
MDEIEAHAADVEYFEGRLPRSGLPEPLRDLLLDRIVRQDVRTWPCAPVELYPALAVDAFDVITGPRRGLRGWTHLGWVLDRLEATWAAVYAGGRDAFWLAAAGHASGLPAAGHASGPGRGLNGSAIRLAMARTSPGPESAEMAIEALIRRARAGEMSADGTARVLADLAPLVPSDDPEFTARVLARFSELDDRVRGRLACHALRAWRLDPARCVDAIWAAFATIRGSSMAEVETEVAETEAYLARRAGMPGPLGL